MRAERKIKSGDSIKCGFGECVCLLCCDLTLKESDTAGRRFRSRLQLDHIRTGLWLHHLMMLDFVIVHASLQFSLTHPLLCLYLRMVLVSISTIPIAVDATLSTVPRPSSTNSTTHKNWITCVQFESPGILLTLDFCSSAALLAVLKALIQTYQLKHKDREM